MKHLQITATLTHLTLAASGMCLAVVTMPLMPEMPYVLAGYLFLLLLSWWLGGQWILPTWAANLLALVIAGGAVSYVLLRVHSDFAFEWTRDMPARVALIPLIAPALMMLVVIRLFGSRSPRDLLQLHGIALLQVALGCVLASGTLFGFLLVAYFVLGLCALAANESRRYREPRPSDDFAAPPKGSRRWLRFGLTWLLLVLPITIPLFLLTPRLDTPDWEPLSRISQSRARAVVSKTGFSDEIDLRRIGMLQNDDTVAFTVKMTDSEGHLQSLLTSDQRWRGAVLDRYEGGVWRSELTSFSNATMFATTSQPRAAGQDHSHLHFHIEERTTSLFLAEPIYPEATPGQLPLIVTEPSGHRPALFFEAGGTVLSATYLPNSQYHYTQFISPGASRTRYPAVRISDNYQQRLLRSGVSAMSDLTGRLLKQLLADDPLHQVIRDRYPDPGERNPLPRSIEPLPPSSWTRICKLLEDHLSRSGTYTYEMASSRSDPSLDPAVDFLTNVRRGPCERYASALALMLRSVGIPARIVKGYRGWELEDAHYVVRQRHAHAWVEALVPAEAPGPLRMEWLLLDPTPSLEEPTGSPIVRWWEQGRRTSESFWQDMILGYGSRRQLALWQDLSAKRLATIGLFVAAVPALLWLLRRCRGRRTRQPESDALGTLFGRLRAVLLARWKLALQPAQTPAELAEQARLLLADDPATRDLADLPARVVSSYYRERFGLLPADPAEVAALSAEMDRLGAVVG